MFSFQCGHATNNSLERFFRFTRKWCSLATHLHTYICTYIQTNVCMFVISLGTACGDSVFCCSGTASGDPCAFISYHRILYSCGHRQWRHFYIFQLISTQHFYVGAACANAVFCSVTELQLCVHSHLLRSGTASGDPCHFIIFHRIISVGTASGDPSHTYIHTHFI